MGNVIGNTDVAKEKQIHIKKRNVFSYNNYLNWVYIRVFDGITNNGYLKRNENFVRNAL